MGGLKEESCEVVKCLTQLPPYYTGEGQATWGARGE